MRLFIRSLLICVPLVFLLASCGDDDDDPTKPTTPTYTLYFSQDSNANGLYRINLTTGEGTIVGDGITNVSGSTVGLAYAEADGGHLYGSKWSVLMEVAKDGSGSTDIGGVGNEALAYDDNSNTLYGCINGAFRTLSVTTGEIVADLTDPGGDVEGLAVDSDTGDVYGVLSGSPASLMMYDVSEGTWSTIGSLGVDMEDTGLAYHPVQKMLYAVEDNASSLYKIDPTDATTTLIGAHGIAGNGGGGLAFAKN